MRRAEELRTYYTCHLASVQELELMENLERRFENYCIFNSQHERIYSIFDIDNYRNTYSDPTELDLNKFDYWTVLDNPITVKLELHDFNGGHGIVPGMLMTMTKDGDYAPTVFIPMIWCCWWTSNLSFFDDPDYIDNYDGYHLLRYLHGGFRFKWNERPFSQIISVFRKGTKITLTNSQSSCNGVNVRQKMLNMHLW